MFLESMIPHLSLADRGKGIDVLKQCFWWHIERCLFFVRIFNSDEHNVLSKVLGTDNSRDEIFISG